MRVVKTLKCLKFVDLPQRFQIPECFVIPSAPGQQCPTEAPRKLRDSAILTAQIYNYTMPGSG